MSVTIRAAIAADVPVMQRIRRAVRDNRLSDPSLIPEASYLAFVETGGIWVAEAQSAVVGFAAVDLPSRSVWALFVQPSAEGAGVGQLLHLHMLSWAQARGLTHLSLSTAKQTRAARFYLRAGWTAAGTTPSGEARFEICLAS